MRFPLDEFTEAPCDAAVSISLHNRQPRKIPGSLPFPGKLSLVRLTMALVLATVDIHPWEPGLGPAGL